MLNLKPGTRIVSHDFDMGDWKADKVEKLDYKTVYYWVVPAKVAGKYQVKAGRETFDLKLEQKFQDVTGTAKIGGKEVPIANGKLTGANLSFDVPMAGRQGAQVRGQRLRSRQARRQGLVRTAGLMNSPSPRMR